MYSACIFCQARLGHNERIEGFPVGSRLAFDPERGRLWAVCPRCRRWNLAPIEARWEPVEECERAFHGTRRRYSTDQIGLARLEGGLDLIRVGRPTRQEFAAWRYGRVLLRRRTRAARATALKAVASVAGFALAGIWFFFEWRDPRRVVARVGAEDGRVLPVTRADLQHLRLRPQGDDGCRLELRYREGVRRGLVGLYGRGAKEMAELSGPAAIRAAGLILPALNAEGGSSAQVERAVRMVDEAGGPERLFSVSPRVPGRPSAIAFTNPEVRLALEMAAHEERERRALEGELARLESEWREAEEIAAIADRLLIPRWIERFIEEHRLPGAQPDEG